MSKIKQLVSESVNEFDELLTDKIPVGAKGSYGCGLNDYNS